MKYVNTNACKSSLPGKKQHYFNKINNKSSLNGNLIKYDDIKKYKKKLMQ